MLIYWVFSLLWLCMPLVIDACVLHYGPFGRFYRARYNILPFQIVMIEKSFFSIMRTKNFFNVFRQELDKANADTINKIMTLAPTATTEKIELNEETRKKTISAFITTHFSVLTRKFSTNCFLMRPFNRHALIFKGSFFNHSCDSNLWYICVFGYVVFFSNRFIKKGAEMNITYQAFSKNVDYVERREYLESTWNFVCTCPKCTLEMKQQHAI